MVNATQNYIERLDHLLEHDSHKDLFNNGDRRKIVEQFFNHLYYILDDSGDQMFKLESISIYRDVCSTIYFTSHTGQRVSINLYSDIHESAIYYNSTDKVSRKDHLEMRYKLNKIFYSII